LFFVSGEQVRTPEVFRVAFAAVAAPGKSLFNELTR
jgi:hypothetical protein